jgi:hypothetical protein
MGTSRKVIKEQLGKEINDFNQAEYGEKLLPGVGFCTAVCVDWARRVLGGRAKAKQALFTRQKEDQDPLEFQKRLKYQTERQLFGQLRFKEMDSDLDAINNLRLKLAMVRNNSDGVHFELSGALQTELRKYVPDLTAKNDGKYERQEFRELLIKLNEKQEKSNRRTNAGWAAFAEYMNDIHKRNRAEQGRQESERKFSGIELLESGEAIGTSVATKIDSMLALEAFGPVTVLLMAFDVKLTDGRESGHAVAANKLGNGNYFFLDPNYGIYYHDLEKLKKALNYLFAGKDAIYGEDGKAVTGVVNYILFGPA